LINRPFSRLICRLNGHRYTHAGIVSRRKRPASCRALAYQERQVFQSPAGRPLQNITICLWPPNPFGDRSSEGLVENIADWNRLPQKAVVAKRMW